jgi:hypothetical protein
MTVPTIDNIVYDVFQAVFYPVMGWAFVSGYLQDKFPLNASILSNIWRSALMRASVVSVVGQAALTYWEGLIGEQPKGLYPILPLFIVCLLSAIAVTMRPAGRFSAFVGASFSATVLFCLVYAVNVAMNGRTIAGDLLLWRSGMVSAIVLIVLMAGAASGETGKRVVSSIGRFLDELARKALKRKLAR